MPDVSPGPERAALPRGRRIAVGGVATFVGLVVAPLVAVAIASLFLFRPAGRILEIEMKATGGQVAQVFWSQNYAFNGNDSGTELLHQHPGDFDRVRFPLPDTRLELIRFDPMNGGGEAIIRSMRVLNLQGQVMQTIDPIILSPLYQIARMTPTKDGLRVVTTPNADDPMLIMKASWIVGESRWHGLQFVTPLSLAWIAGATLTLILVASGFVARDVLRQQFDRRQLLWFAALFLAVVWGKAQLLHTYPVPVPFWDQWDGEGLTLYIPWAHDGLSWRQMFTLHNEHRIFFSRVLAMTLVAINGQWDPHLQIVVNSLLHGLAAVVFAGVFWLAVRRQLPLIVGVVGLAFAPPFALENSMNGFQSAFYFLILFSGLALWLMGMHRVGSKEWWLGWFCAFCCPFTVAGGTFILAALGTIAVLKTIAQPREWRQGVVNLLALSAVAGVAYSGLPPPIPYHETLKAANFHSFLVALERNLAFPFIDRPRASFVVWLPFALWLGAVLRRRLRTTAAEQIPIAVGVWVILQAIAIAYTRGMDGIPPASRYQDMLAFGFVVNTIAALSWLDVARGWRRVAAIAFAVGWFAVGAAGIGKLSREMLATGAHQRREWAQEHVRTVRQFIETDNLDEMLDKRGPQQVPYHSPWMLAFWLEHPYIRHILPAVVRAPIALKPAVTAGSFAPAWSAADGEILPIFDSYAVNRAKGEGRFESQPIACTEFHQLRFDVAGAARDSKLRLALHDVATGRDTVVRPTPGTLPGWSGVSVRCPSGPFTVVASDNSPISWFAFRQPAEIGAGSAIAESLIQRSPLLGIVVGGLVLLGLAAEIRLKPPVRP